MTGLKKNIAMNVALSTIAEVVKTATDAMRELTKALRAMSQSLRRIEKLLDEQTGYLVETKDVVAEQANLLGATKVSTEKKPSSAKRKKSSKKSSTAKSAK